MKNISITQEKVENELMETFRGIDVLPISTQPLGDTQLNNRQAAQRVGDNKDFNKTRIRRLLFSIARERANLHKWNINALVLSYFILITVVLLMLNGISALIVGLAAVIGLAILWFFGRMQSKIMEKQFYRKEVQQYIELLSAEEMDNSNKVEASSSMDNVKSPLTQREIEVLIQVAKGQLNKEIGTTLGIKEDTIRNHLTHIFDKLGVNDRTSAVVMALRNGWINMTVLSKPRY